MKVSPELVLRGHWYIDRDVQRTVERTDGLQVWKVSGWETSKVILRGHLIKHWYP